jgi:hypothetical protein
MSLDAAFIADGMALGYDGTDLRDYVKKCKVEQQTREQQALEERRRISDEDRERRLHDRELRELELRKIETDLELARVRSQNVVARDPSTESDRSFIKLANYRDGSDVAVYFKTFEMVREANRWSDPVALSALANGFSGTRISSFISTLPSDFPYEEVKMQIIKSFGFTIYDYQAKFHNTKQGSESFRQYVLFLRENLNKMCNLVSVGKDYQKFEDMVIKDQILSSVNKQLSEFLKERDIFKIALDEVIQIADNYQAIHGKALIKPKIIDNSISHEVKCFKCNKLGHIARNCRVKMSNYIHGPNKNVSDTCQQRPVLPGQRLNTKICDSCGNSGHYARYCKFNVNKHGPENYSVANKDLENVKVNVAIKANGDYTRTLPVSFGKCNGKRVKILRDTGTTSVLVRKSLVSEGKISKQLVELTFADGSKIRAPKATVYLDTPYFTGETNAICLDTLPFDVLLGNIPGAACPCSCDSGTELAEAAYAVQTRNQARTDCLPEVSTKAGSAEIKFNLDTIDTQELIALQRDDPKLQKFFEKTSNISCNYPKLILRNNVLVKLCIKEKNSKNVVQQIMLPEKLKHRVMSLAHDNIFAGHLGIRKTQDRILSHFFWAGCYSDIRRYCRSCEICQKNAINKPARVPLINLPVIDRPFSRVAVDIIGPLPKSHRGNRFALVSIDLATKYPDAVPLKRIDSESVAEALLEIYSRVGLPNEILHDQGTQFMSATMRKFNQLLQIKSIRTAPYNPKCNGTCEGFNKCLKLMLKKISDEDPLTWDRFLQPLLFAYREVPQASTGFSPFELLFGFEVRGPLFLIKERLLDLDCETEEIPVTTYVMEMRERLKQFMKLANENELCSKRKEKVYYDRRSRNRKFNVADKVLLLLPTSASKLLAEWRGPYEVVRRLNKVDYVVRIDDKERTFHINMLKAFRERLIDKPEQVYFSEDVCGSFPNKNSLVDTGLIENFNFGDNLCNEEIKALCNVIKEIEHVFSDVPGKVNFMQYQIQMDSSVRPRRSAPYKLPFHLKDQVRTEIEKWLDIGIIKKSMSEWASPIVVVKNPDNSIRITVDYRAINSFVNVDNFPMPSIDSVLEKLETAVYMTKLDLTKAFFQLPLTPDSNKYTAFVTEFGHYEFNVVPFGIRFATGLCNRIMCVVLQDCERFVGSFVDDLIVFSNSFEEHIEHVKLVLSKLSASGLTLNKKKCIFGCTSVKFLGFEVGNGQIKPDEAKIEAIRNFPRPIVKKDMRAFLGLLNFYRRFVPNIAICLTPLTDALRRIQPDKVVWSEDRVRSFKEALNLIVNDMSLYIPRKDSTFILQTDACEKGIGAVLWQRVGNEDRPVSFISRKLNSAEKNYAIIEQECLAIKWAINKFHDYLYGYKFIVRTDHAPLQWLHQNKDTTSRRMRWAMSLQAYSFTIEYIKGRENFLADILSRNPHGEE